METRNQLYIDGQWVPSSATGTLEVIRSATEQVIARVPAGTIEDVDRAVEAAVRAFPAWADRSVAQRAAVLAAIAEGLIGAGAIPEVTAQEVGIGHLSASRSAFKPVCRSSRSRRCPSCSERSPTRRGSGTPW